MTNRDACNPAALALAVSRYLAGKSSDVNLLAVCMQDGVITPAEASEAFIEQPEADPTRVDVFIGDGSMCIMIDTSGSVDVMAL